jgi:hypothetical protein
MASFLRGCPTADDAVLLVSELAANACAHSASGRPGGTFVVRAQVSDGSRVYAEVEDQGSSWDGTFSTAESPHGLYLLRALSTECGTRRGDRGWITWFVLDQQRPLSLAAPSPAPSKGIHLPMTSGVGITLETALATACQTLASVAERAKQHGYYSGARTEIINAHADNLRAALDMLVKVAVPGDPSASGMSKPRGLKDLPDNSVTR